MSIKTGQEESEEANSEDEDDQVKKEDSLPSSNPTNVVGPPAATVAKSRVALRDATTSVSAPSNASIVKTVLLESTTSATTSTTLAEPPSPNPSPLCNSATELPTFIRHANSVFSAVIKSASQKNTGSPNANFIIKMSTLQECGGICRRQNIEGMEVAEGGPFQCHGFSFTSVRKRGIAVNSPAEDSCNFFDNNAIVINMACY